MMVALVVGSWQRKALKWINNLASSTSSSGTWQRFCSFMRLICYLSNDAELGSIGHEPHWNAWFSSRSLFMKAWANLQFALLMIIGRLVNFDVCIVLHRSALTFLWRSRVPCAGGKFRWMRWATKEQHVSVVWSERSGQRSSSKLLWKQSWSTPPAMWTQTLWWLRDTKESRNSINEHLAVTVVSWEFTGTSEITSTAFGWLRMWAKVLLPHALPLESQLQIYCSKVLENHRLSYFLSAYQARAESYLSIANTAYNSAKLNSTNTETGHLQNWLL